MTPPPARTLDYKAPLSRPLDRPTSPRSVSDLAFVLCLALIGGLYVFLIVAMLLADMRFTTPGHLLASFKSPEIRFATRLSLLSCTVTMILSLWAAIPLGYLM